MVDDNKGFSRSERALYQRLANLALSDCSILVEKGRSYGDSWKQRGGIGAFMMLARKWDRIENAVKRNGYDVFVTYDKDKREEGIIDDIRDLRRYLLLVEQHVQRDVFSEMAESGSLDEDDDDQSDHAQSIRLEVQHEQRRQLPSELCTYCLSSEHELSGCEKYRRDKVLKEHCPD
jgi:hypothetical protein